MTHHGPLVVQQDRTVLLEVQHPEYEQARDRLQRFAELEKSPEFVHFYRITPISVWNAAALGENLDELLDWLLQSARFPVAPQVVQQVREWYRRYGMLRLLAHDKGRLLLECDDQEVLRKLCQNVLLAPLVESERGRCFVAADDRGELKQVLVRLGYPVDDRAGYRRGGLLAFDFRERAASGRPFALRAYQQKAAEAFWAAGSDSGGCGVVVLPCGAGKTVVAIAAMQLAQAHTLVLTTNTVAVRQWIRELLDKTSLKSDQVGEYTGDQKEIRPVTVATYQILTWRRQKLDTFEHLALFDQGDWGLIVYDEVHLLPAPVFRATAGIQARRRLGLTATLVREDGRQDEVFSLIGPKRCEVPWKQLERQGFLATAHCYEVRVALGEARMQQYQAAGARAQFRVASENEHKLDAVGELLRMHAGDRVLVIGQFLEQVRQIAAVFQLPLITGATPTAEREQLYAAFRRGEHKQLVVSKVGNFAVDLPDANVAIQVSGTFGSRQEEAQRLGRILRPKSDGSSALFYSLVSDGTREQEFARRRQLFLTEQGYGYAIVTMKDLGHGPRRELMGMSRITLRALLHGNGEQTLLQAAQRWCGGAVPTGRDEQLRACTSAMEHEDKVRSRLQELSGKLQELLETFLQQPGTVRTVQDLFQSHGRNFKSRFDLEASLAALHREGFLFPAKDKRWASFDSPCWAVPGELADTVIGFRRRQQSSLKDTITLQGFLQARYFREREGEDPEKINDHARKIYKLYLMPGSIDGRVQRLAPALRKTIDLALMRHGGLCSHQELQKELGDDTADLAAMRRCLEEGMLGTAGPLELARLGIQNVTDAVIVFHEVALHLIQRHGAEAPPEVEQALCSGVNLGSNVGRFLKELGRTKVQFTVDGALFKASCKRIASLLLPVPGAVLDPEEQLELVYRFCLNRRLIDRRGERVLGVTQGGHDFERSELLEQQKCLLAFCVEDRSLPGEHFHQVRLRRVLLRLLRRAEPEQWQELQLLPFLARNTYLSQLDTQQAENYFAARFQGGSYTPGDTLQQLVWHLVVWVKKRLHPLGLVDLGLREGRPVAMRLSRLGASLLDAEPAGKVGGVRSQVIVNPDFEVLVYPGDDVHEVVHAFDKFARRLKSDQVHQFKLEPETVRQALRDGMRIDAIVRELTDRSRTAIPQNVLYTLAEWGSKA